MLNTTCQTYQSNRKFEFKNRRIVQLLQNTFIELGAWTVAVGFIFAMIRLSISIL